MEVRPRCETRIDKKFTAGEMGRTSIFACFSLTPGLSRVTSENKGNSAVSTAFRLRENP
jgi:hypothetical protein